MVCGEVWFKERIPKKTSCVSQHTWGIDRLIQPFNEHKDLHSENAMHISFENHEENGYYPDLNSVTNSC